MKSVYKTHPLWKRGLAFFAAFAMVLAMVMPSAPVAKAAGTTLAVAQYTSASGKVAEGSTAKNATYNGTWEASVPMGKVMAAMESEMQSLAQGFFGHYFYPHGKDGANKIAYIEYRVTFPEGVTVDASKIQMNNSTAMFNRNAFSSSVSGQTVTFKFPLQDQNWKGIYALYQKDGGAQSEKTINFSIPYTVNATSKEEAAKAENMNITAQGDFSTCPSGSSWPKNMNVTNTDQSVRSLAPDFSKAPCFANAPGGDPNPPDPKPQDPNPQDPKPSETAISLDADLLLGENTGNMPIEKKKDDVMSFVGTLDVKSIKDKMDEIKKLHASAESDKIAISELKSEFTATLELPEGLEFSGNKEAVFTGGNGVFAITKQTVEGKKASVTFALQKPEEIKNYTSLDKKIKSVDNKLKVTFRDVKFSESAKPNTDYEVIGKVWGSMEGTATYPDSTSATNKKPAPKMMLKNAMSLSAIEETKPKTLKFAFQWNGKQSKDGKSNQNADAIALTVKYAGQNTDNVSATGDLDGDLLINGDTQHTDVYLTGMDTPFTMTGLLNVKPIKDELSKLKAAHPQSVADKDIEVSKVATSFTATMTLPDELKFPAGAATKATLDGANGKFKIESAVVSGQTITVTMVPTLDLTKLTRPFEEISNTVEGVEDELKVNVPGITVDSTKAKSNINYTIHGTVKGDFSALATTKSSGKTIQFNYTWNGIQKKGGEDSTDPTTKDIKLTLKTADFSKSVALCGDILVNGNTEHDAVYVAGQDATVPFTGKLDVTPVKNQLKTIEAKLNPNNIDPKDIELTNYSSLFTATLTLPNEMDFVASPKVTLKNDNGKYTITGWKINGKTITVNMTVNATVSTFKDLKDAVEQMGDALEAEVNGAKFNASALANTNYTVYGTMNGELKAKATHKTSGTSLTFAFTWNAKQCKDGADYLYLNSDNISFSLKWVKSTPPTPPTPPTPNPPTPNPPTPNPPTPNPPTPNPPTPNPPTPNPPTPNPPTPNPPTPNPPTPNPPTPNPPTPVEPNKPKPVEPTPSKPSAKTPTAPKTGDIASMLLCGGAFLLSSFGYAASKVKRGKRKHDE